jgi:hypothetical protein
MMAQRATRDATAHVFNCVAVVPLISVASVTRDAMQK